MRNVISPLILAVVLIAALALALIPFLFLVFEPRLGSDRYLPAMLAVVTVFFFLLPLGVRFLTPRPRHARGAR